MTSSRFIILSSSKPHPFLLKCVVSIVDDSATMFPFNSFKSLPLNEKLVLYPPNSAQALIFPNLLACLRRLNLI
ncbi:unnamed protein product [Linum trigynum]